MFCCFCGNKLVWQSDFDTDDEEGIISIYQCFNESCNKTFEFVDIFENEEKYIKYFESE